MQILLVDDKKDILDTMGEILEVCHNHTVQGASSGKEALKWFRKKNYDLVVVDLGLPVMNGVELIAKMRKVNAKTKTKIVVLTGIPCDDAIRLKLQNLDVHQIFSKPKGIQELLLYIKKVASKHSAA